MGLRLAEDSRVNAADGLRIVTFDEVHPRAHHVGHLKLQGLKGVERNSEGRFGLCASVASGLLRCWRP